MPTTMMTANRQKYRPASFSFSPAHDIAIFPVCRVILFFHTVMFHTGEKRKKTRTVQIIR